MSVVYITGTDTGVGKTIVAATLAVALGGSVAVYKPTQAGLEDGLGDIDVVHRLTGLTSVYEGIRLAYPMAPVAAAAREGVGLPPLTAHAEKIATLASRHDHVLVEGAGGLLVALDADGNTIADFPGPFIVVCRAGLGTLNHTALTLTALSTRNREVAGLIIGAWPARPDEIDESNRVELGRLSRLLGAVPGNAGRLDTAAFQRAAPGWVYGFGRRLETVPH